MLSENSRIQAVFHRLQLKKTHTHTHIMWLQIGAYCLSHKTNLFSPRLFGSVVFTWESIAGRRLWWRLTQLCRKVGSEKWGRWKEILWRREAIPGGMTPGRHKSKSKMDTVGSHDDSRHLCLSDMNNNDNLRAPWLLQLLVLPKNALLSPPRTTEH